MGEKRKCANGCDAPSERGFCICRACVDKITAKLEDLVSRAQAQNPAPPETEKGAK